MEANAAGVICEVFPTHVGMNRLMVLIPFLLVSIPHARGDEPCRDTLKPECDMYSPRTWG